MRASHEHQTSDDTDIQPQRSHLYTASHVHPCACCQQAGVCVFGLPDCDVASSANEPVQLTFVSLLRRSINTKAVIPPLYPTLLYCSLTFFTLLNPTLLSFGWWYCFLRALAWQWWSLWMLCETAVNFIYHSQCSSSRSTDKEAALFTMGVVTGTILWPISLMCLRLKSSTRDQGKPQWKHTKIAE